MGWEAAGRVAQQNPSAGMMTITLHPRACNVMFVHTVCTGLTFKHEMHMYERLKGRVIITTSRSIS
jgi:hypothetical protein